MVFGALAHIKQVSETHIKHVQESKQPKSKSSRDILIILYELFVGTLYNLSNVCRPLLYIPFILLFIFV